MLKLLILADDFTGALDSGVQLSKSGAVTRVVTDRDYFLKRTGTEISEDVLVINTETRHDSPQIARTVVESISKRAKEAGIPVLYKKTDSALRGNIGAELEGALEGAGARQLYFVPAFPKLGRTTKNGTHYLDSVPIAQTVFGRDPFSPVKNSYVPDIIAQQSRVPVTVVEQKALFTAVQPGIFVFDATTDKEIAAVAEQISPIVPTTVIAGCAGLAEHLPKLLELSLPPRHIRVEDAGVLVISGSLNPITTQQLQQAQADGFESAVLTDAQKLQGIPEGQEGEEYLCQLLEQYKQTGRLVVFSDGVAQPQDCSDLKYDGKIIAANMGRMARRLFDKGFGGVLVVTGGDTLRGVLEGLECTDLMPLYEIETGVVLAQAVIDGKTRLLVSKSGGIGTKEVFQNIFEDLTRLAQLPVVAAKA